LWEQCQNMSLAMAACWHTAGWVPHRQTPSADVQRWGKYVVCQGCKRFVAIDQETVSSLTNDYSLPAMYLSHGYVSRLKPSLNTLLYVASSTANNVTSCLHRVRNKRCHYIFDYNSRSHCTTVIIFAPMDFSLC